MDAPVIVLLLLIVGWSLVARRFDRWSVTAPIALLVSGYLIARLGGFDVEIDQESLSQVAEIALVLTLFNDASRVRVPELVREKNLPGRLLFIGLPLTMVFGGLTAALLFGGRSWWIFALIAATLAPTDAALASSIIDDRRIPQRIRTLLNVESGLNDGLVTPFVAFFIAGATLDENKQPVSHAVGSAVVDLAIAVGVGIVIAGVGFRLTQTAQRRGWSDRGLEPIAVLALALLCYFVALWLDGNGFVAAFVGGLVFGNVSRHRAQDEVTLTDQLGRVLGYVVWFTFGMATVLVLPNVTWEIVAYAVLSLTIVRIGPVLLALWGSGLPIRESLLVGWLGPRGLASLVFAILAFDSLAESDGQLVLATVTVTVILSVIAHGLSAGPLAKRFAASSTVRG